MVEPVSLTVGALVAALVTKAAQTAGEQAVEGGAGALGRLVSRLREHFRATHDDTGGAALARVEDAPDSPSRALELATVLDQHAARDSAFEAELQSLVREAQSAGVDIEAVTQTVWGNQNVQVAGLVDSDVNVSYNSPPPSQQPPPDEDAPRRGAG
jgi:hypothetical protein